LVRSCGSNRSRGPEGHRGESKASEQLKASDREKARQQLGFTTIQASTNKKRES
jgi:hypothetical protein